MFACAWGASLLALAAFTLWRSIGRTTNGFIAYYAASRLLVAGQLGSLVYDDGWFMGYVQHLTHTSVLEIYGPNSPMMALLGIPTVVFGPDGGRTLWLAGSLVALAVTTAIVFREVTRDGTDVPLVVVPLVLLSPAVFANLNNGQAYLFVFGAYGVAALALLSGRDSVAGTVLGLAFALKSAGLSVFVLLAAQRRFRALAAAAAGCLVTVLVVFPWVNRGMWFDYLAYVWKFVQRPSVSVTAYQTTDSLVRRLCMQDSVWNPAPAANCAGVALIVPHVLVVSALAATVWLSAGRPVANWMAAGFTLCVLDVPIAAEPHFVSLGIPVLFLMAAWVRRPTRSWWPWVAFAFLLFVPLDYSARRFTSGWSVLLAYPRLYAAWLLWGMAMSEMARGRADGLRHAHAHRPD